MRTLCRVLMIVALATMPAAFVARSAHAENTLDRILREKVLRVAIDVANPPFGILDKDGQPDGSDVAVARQLAKDLGAEIEFVQVPSTGRIPALLVGPRRRDHRVDLGDRRSRQGRDVLQSERSALDHHLRGRRN